MRILSIALLVLSLASSAFGQAPQWRKPRYLAEINDKAENFILTGALYSVTDSSVILTCSSCKAAEAQNFRIEIPFLKMDEISIRRNFSFNYWLISGIGFGAAAFAYAYNDNNPPGFLFAPFMYPVAFFFLGALPFVIAGTFVSILPREDIIINKEFRKFSSGKNMIKKYCFIQ
jgi:hypothetical protein